MPKRRRTLADSLPLVEKGGVWVLATHLRELLSHIGTEGVKVTVAKTKPGYKIVRRIS